jgi:hypothetical protein
VCNKVPRNFYFGDAALGVVFGLRVRDLFAPADVLFTALAAGAERFAASLTFFFGALEDGDFSVAFFSGAACDAVR